MGGLTAVMGMLMITDAFGVLLGTVALLHLSARLSKLPQRVLLGNLKPLIPILLLTVTLNACLTPGKSVLRLSEHLAFTEAGLARGGFLALRLGAMVIGTTLLTLTTSPLELADGIETLFRPLQRFRIPVHELAMTVTIALRFVPILVDEANRLHSAQLARGADFGGGPIRRIRSLLPLLLPLFVSAFGRADRLAIAMEARCYRGHHGRTHYQTLTLAGRDYAVLIGIFLFCGLALSASEF